MTRSEEIADCIDRHAAACRRIHKRYDSRCNQIARVHRHEPHAHRLMWYREAANTRNAELETAQGVRDVELAELGQHSKTQHSAEQATG